ncbi:integrin alpha-D isoform X1 [Micropterus salmoides]|uniref:integrin alpha-D isoform X1 n=1 Tax=Micropterus salmoides TaxID=27706 RepID=UPI0018ED38C8|nr:integrin alpha-D isoform X1 [Micropterus salmoides]
MWKMQGPRRIFLLAYMVAVAIPVSLAFNIDITNPEVYNGSQKDFFGYKVLQFMSGTDKGLLVTAPLRQNGSGGIIKPHQNTPQWFKPQVDSLEDASIKHLGLSIAVDATHSQFTVCSPSVVHECYENSYLNSVCYNITQDLQQTSYFRPAFQECTKKTVDLVFLFDGSGSMTETEFNKNKDFIVDIMDSLINTSVKFAAVQFSFDYKMVFNFNDFNEGRALDKLKNEPHMKSLTNTHKALKFVLEEIFDKPDAGASPDATKVLVLITDGDPSDTDNYGIIKRYNEKQVIRFVIGVKAAKLDKFTDIASDPTDKYAFQIENYDGLTGILEKFQKKIFTMEGTKVSRAGEMTNEMSQSGFSAVFYKDTLILGSVGTKSWRGSLEEVQEQKQTQIDDPHMQMDSYMGYSISVGEKSNAPLYFTGAPRFNHTGQVVLFRKENKNWIAAQRLNGDQIGSYFGAELCSVDVNSDGNTDFLLVGAPLFYQPQVKREGQIYVYTLTDEMQLRSELNVTAPSMGRFGTTISSLADLNGDGLRDVAVGAPLEDDNSGAVYIYLGNRHRGIRSHFSQRIMGKKVEPWMRFFGQAIDGDIDLGEDGLPDIAVGSQGMAVVLRSRPVFNVTAHLSFHPKQISTDKIVCPSTKEDLTSTEVDLTVCFEMVEVTKIKPGVMTPEPNISYTLGVDPTRQTHRGQIDNKAWILSATHNPRDEDKCINHTIYMPKCVKDTLSPIIIKLNFSQDDNGGKSGILNVDSKRQAVVEVPFEKTCRLNDTCIAELEVDFMATKLLVAEDNFFILDVNLTNRGDDSYNTSLTMHYPPGLSFSRMTIVKNTRPAVLSCHDLDEIFDKTVCGVSLPVFHSRSAATFRASFRLMNDYKWNDTISITITGESENANSTTSSVTKSIPVHFEIKMQLTVSDDTITYLNFTTEDSEPKKMIAIYKVENLGINAFPVNVSLFFPTKLEYDFEMKNYQVFVQQNKTQCTDIHDKESEYCSQNQSCKMIVCDSFILDKESSTEFVLLGEVQFRNLKERAANIAFLKQYTGFGAMVKFKSFIHVDYDKKRYVQEGKSDESGSRKYNDTTKKGNEVRIDLIIHQNVPLINATGSVLGFLLLVIIALIMFKLGCFKRKEMGNDDEEEEEEHCIFTESTPINAVVNESETDCEEKEFLQATTELQPNDTKEELE